MDLVYMVIKRINRLDFKLCILHVLATGDIRVFQMWIVKKYIYSNTLHYIYVTFL